VERARSVTPARVAIITGASSGIGRATAFALAADGFTVLATARRQERLDELVAEITASGGRATAEQCDVRDEASVHGLFAHVLEVFGRVDLLFNNAGVFPTSQPLEDVALTDWLDAVATNLTGVFLCTREAFRVMKNQHPQGGRIINNGSISAHAPRAHSVAYAATKHAITGLTKSASLDGRAYNIACGQIDIGNAATQLLDGGELLQADGSRRLEPTMPVADVARAVSYMASLPLEANVQFMTVMATSMPYIGRG
jgi:NAD(P)-dependent dehydrogenase (short-subunit alcohol dehydrogenase family)